MYRPPPRPSTDVWRPKSKEKPSYWLLSILVTISQGLRLKMFIKCSVWQSNPPQVNAEKKTNLIRVISCHTVKCYCHTEGLTTALRFVLNWSKVSTEKATFINQHWAETPKTPKYKWHHSKYPNWVTLWYALVWFLKTKSHTVLILATLKFF